MRISAARQTERTSRRLDDRYAEDGDVSEYRALLAAGAVVIATDTATAFSSFFWPEIIRTQTRDR